MFEKLVFEPVIIKLLNFLSEKVLTTLENLKRSQWIVKIDGQSRKPC